MFFFMIISHMHGSTHVFLRAFFPDLIFWRPSFVDPYPDLIINICETSKSTDLFFWATVYSVDFVALKLLSIRSGLVFSFFFYKCPTKQLTLWKPQNPGISELYVALNCRSTDLGALKLWKGRPGTRRFRSPWNYRTFDLFTVYFCCLTASWTETESGKGERTANTKRRKLSGERERKKEIREKPNAFFIIYLYVQTQTASRLQR